MPLTLTVKMKKKKHFMNGLLYYLNRTAIKLISSHNGLEK